MFYLKISVDFFIIFSYLRCRVAQLVKCLVTSGYPDGSRSGGQGFKSRWKREFLENSENYLRFDNSSIKGTLCSAKSGCRVAQLVNCLVTSGYPDGSRSGGPLARYARSGKIDWKVLNKDCPEVNSSQRWCLCKNVHVVWSHGDLGSSRSSFSS